MTKLGFQLYSARNYQPFSGVFRKLAAAGYGEVEGYGALYDDLDEAGLDRLASDLEAIGLSMPTGHFGLAMLENNPDRVLEIASRLKMDSVFCPFLLPDQRPDTAGGWKEFGARLEAAGKPFRDAGLVFGWHNHNFEFELLPDGTAPMRHIMAGGPTLAWEADIAWVIRGDADPYFWIELFKERITAVHVKDIAEEGENEDEDGWADVGYGTVDWKGLMKVLKSMPIKHYIVEHDNPNDIDRLVERSIASFQTF
ncbi:sugar phosphate isomerase/epimerase [Martelella lutilitoris]|uniref:Sugar phosphate isomerase/epimerase n=1 Tax=Martelella lutilitoris TaxID=2583532 RepID=A0A5C4JRX0_9HYPH|nr:sugar phosphate isomerase/epimerase [Martelella lutilitoris]TNB48017.1 sugar phosphate isomerase/epimerase [Martelella lutilitoris]